METSAEACSPSIRLEPLSSRSTNPGYAPIAGFRAPSCAEAGLEPETWAVTPIEDTEPASATKTFSIQNNEPGKTAKDTPLSPKHITGIAALFLLCTIAFAVSSSLVKSTRSPDDLFDPGCIDKLGDSGSPGFTQVFDLDLTFGNFTFTNAKILDVAWDTTIGHGDGNIVPLNTHDLALCWVLDGSRFDSVEDIVEVGPDFSALAPLTTSFEYTTRVPCIDAYYSGNINVPTINENKSNPQSLVYTSGGWKAKQRSTIWDHFGISNGSNNIQRSSENFQSIRSYAITRQLFQISLDPHGWLTNGSEVQLPGEGVLQDENSLDWWSTASKICTFRNLTSSRPRLRPSFTAAQLVSPQTTPIPADSQWALEFGVPENTSWTHFSLGNVSGELLPPGQMPYNSTLWLNGNPISLPAPFIDVGHNCSGNNAFGSLGNCICYKGQPISFDLLGEERAVCNTAPGYVWGFSSYLLRLGLAFEATWMACCLICYLWLSLRCGLVKKKIMRSAGPMKFSLEFSEAVCEIDDAAAGMCEDELKARLKGVNVGYRPESVVTKNSGLRHRVVAGLERQHSFLELIGVDKTWRLHKPTDGEVYEDLNWHIYER